MHLYLLLLPDDPRLMGNPTKPRGTGSAKNCYAGKVFLQQRDAVASAHGKPPAPVSAASLLAALHRKTADLEAQDRAAIARQIEEQPTAHASRAASLQKSDNSSTPVCTNRRTVIQANISEHDFWVRRQPAVEPDVREPCCRSRTSDER